VPESVARWRVRPAEPGDGELVIDMVLLAFNWRPVVGLSRLELLGDPELAKYATPWPRRGDIGVVAEEGGEGIGAGWVRRFERGDRSYGFVDRKTPELTLAVRPPWRGQGVGRALLRSLFDAAGSAGVERISLSVEQDNSVASSLYLSEGFRVVASKNRADTMVKDLGGTG
jgi:GNAT superfamily N-acetyltransferase